MRIVVDAMGSDSAPIPEIKGAVQSCQELPELEVILVGDEARLKPELEKYAKDEKISVVHAPDVIAMNDSPMAVRSKKKSSLVVGMGLVKAGKADGLISAGNTGAVMLTAWMHLRPIEGVQRVPIAQLFPTMRNPALLLDLGANVDCSARHLCDFAEMGAVYSERVRGVSEPRVGLLNIGEEQLKGNEVAKNVHKYLSAAPHINFVGNIEPRAMYRGSADVVVCDGFAGNLVLKTSEAAGGLIKNLLERELKSTFTSKIGALLSSGAFRRMKQTIDPNEYPGAQLLGVNGTVVILHGSVHSKGVYSAIKGAVRVAASDIPSHIRKGIQELREVESQQGAKDDES